MLSKSLRYGLNISLLVSLENQKLIHEYVNLAFINFQTTDWIVLEYSYCDWKYGSVVKCACKPHELCLNSQNPCKIIDGHIGNYNLSNI